MAKSSRRPIQLFLLVISLVAGCAQLKQCAYRGINRDQWQQPEKVIAALQIRPGDRVADLGSGGGYFTFKLAASVGPTGKVYAVDVDREMVDLIEKQAQRDGVKNVETILAKADDPLLPKDGVDLIFTSNTYHHFDDRIAYFTSLRKYLTPRSEFIKREMEQAGYTLRQEFDFLDRQSFIVFTAAK
ncbi:MAG: SAM-dependent methlyltransferase [Deltaproteobacteria bacterium]|nr:SAM-dependent methlyltransferase [Deltaproteobacteria bacterium]